MATASITYNYPNFWFGDYKYGIDSKHTSNSGEYISPPVSYVDRYGYYHFNNPVPTLKRIKCTYHFYSSTAYFFNVTHALYVRVGSSWYSTTAFSLTRKASDDTDYTYMAEYEVDVTVNRNNVTDFCILPTSMPSRSSSWLSWASTHGTITITETFNENTMDDTDYLTNISYYSISKRDTTSYVDDTFYYLYEYFRPKIISLPMDNEIINATEIHVNIDGVTKKITSNAKIGSGSYSWSSSQWYDGFICYSFIAPSTDIVFTRNTTSRTDDSWTDDLIIIDSTTMNEVYSHYNAYYSGRSVNNLIVGRKYYILCEVYDSTKNDENISVDFMIYPLINMDEAISNMITPDEETSSLSFIKASSMRKNVNGLIKLNVTTLPKNMYFMMYENKIGTTYQNTLIEIYDRFGNGLYYNNNNSSKWSELQTSHPTLYAKSSYQSYDPLIITDKEYNTGPYYISFRHSSKSGTSMMNYTIEWGSL